MASIRKYKNKGDKKYSYEYRIKYTDPITGKVKEKSKRGFKSPKEAEMEALEVEKKLMVGDTGLIENENLTIQEWIDQYFEIYGSQLRKTTLHSRKVMIKNHITHELGNIKLQKLNRLNYQKFINKKLETLKESTVKNIHGKFMVLINKAVQHEILDRNRLKGVTISKSDEDNELKFLTREEVDLFMNTAKNFPFDEYVAVFTLLRTGLRKGELLALTWSDIDFNNQILTVNKNRNALGTFPPKTKKSNRIISLDNRLIKELKSLQTWQKKNKLKSHIYKETDYLIVDENGIEYHEWKLNKILSNISKDANIQKISPHTLRHTHAVMLLESGVDIKTVSDRLGHTKINMTADVYLHVSRKQENEAVAKLEKYLE